MEEGTWGKLCSEGERKRNMLSEMKGDEEVQEKQKVKEGGL